MCEVQVVAGKLGGKLGVEVLDCEPKGSGLQSHPGNPLVMVNCVFGIFLVYPGKLTLMKEYPHYNFVTRTLLTITRSNPFQSMHSSGFFAGWVNLTLVNVGCDQDYCCFMSA